MGKKAGRNKNIILVLAAFVVAGVLAVIAIAGLPAAPTFGEKSAGLPAAQRDPGEQQLAETKASSGDSRRVILSMGERDDTMYISWSGDEGGPRLVRVSDDRYSLPVTVPVRAVRTKFFGKSEYRYNAMITGLEVGETYYYEIGDGVIYDGPEEFTVSDGEVFAYMGDPQFDESTDDYAAWGALAANMYETNPEVGFVLLGGDMVNLPKKSHWGAFLDSCGVFKNVPMMTVPGNHEGVTSNNTYKRFFHHVGNGPDGEAFYWFEKGRCRFIMLDSSFMTKARQVAMGKGDWRKTNEKIKSWLEETLRTSEKTWNIVVIHHPVYGLHDMFTVSPEVREEWLPIMEEGGVDLVLCGHQHVYMRTRALDGIVYVMGVSGAKQSKYYSGINEPIYSESIYAAGPNYQILRATDDKLEITSYNEKGSIVDAACIKKGVSPPYFRIFW